MTRPVVVLWLVTMLGALLRLYHLEFKSLWLDEARLFWIATGDLKQVLQQNAAYNSAPPLFALLLRAVLGVDDSEPALRSIACIAGVAAVPAMYLLAREFASSRIACVAALLVAVAPGQVRYSQQVREYALAFLLAVGMLLAFCRFTRQPTMGSTFLLVSVVSVSFFTQYGLALLFLAINLVAFTMLFRMEQPRRAYTLWLVLLLFASLAVMGVYHLALKEQFSGGRAAYYLHGAYWDGSFRSLARMAILNTEHIFLFAFPTPLMVFACALGLLEATRDPSRKLAVWLLVAPMIVTFGLAMARMYPYVGTRHTMFLLPMIYVFAALGVGFLSRQRYTRIASAVLVILLVGYGLAQTARYQRDRRPENIRPVVAQLLAESSKKDRIYVHSGATDAFKYYVRGVSRPWIEGENKNEDPRRYAEQLDALLEDRSTLWLVFSHIRQGDLQQVLAYIASRRKLEAVHEGEGAWLYVVR
jgi:uncharacterized membrane protein